MGMGFRMWAHSGLPSGHLPLPPLERCGDALGAPDFGPWGAWRAFVAPYCQSWALLCDTPDRLAANMAYVVLVMYASEEFGWTP